MTDSLTGYRKQFPVLSKAIYANTAAAGPISERLFEWRQEHELDMLMGGSEQFLEGLKVIKNSRDKLARFFNCASDQVALVPNFSLGLNLLLQAIPPNQKVLLIEEDYPSVNWPFELLGHSIFKVPVGEYLEEELQQKIENEGVEVLAISLVQWLSGAMIDLEWLKKIKGENPNLTIIADGTQFCGMFPFDFSNSGIDVLIASGYKWMLAGYGNGFMVFDRQLMERYSPMVIGFGSAKGNIEGRDSISFCQFFEAGHLDSLSFGSLGVSLDFLNEIGMKSIGEQNQKLSEAFLKSTASLPWLPDWVAKRRLHSTIFSLKAPSAVYQRLVDRGVVCAQRGGGIRLSFHFYNQLSEVETITKILKN